MWEGGHGASTVLPPALPQAVPGSARSEAVDMRSVRWAVWSPVAGAGEAEVVLPLRGGARRGPCQALVYRTPPSSRSSRQVRAGFCSAGTRGCSRGGTRAGKPYTGWRWGEWAGGCVSPHGDTGV